MGASTCTHIYTLLVYKNNNENLPQHACVSAHTHTYTRKISFGCAVEPSRSVLQLLGTFVCTIFTDNSVS